MPESEPSPEFAKDRLKFRAIAADALYSKIRMSRNQASAIVEIYGRNE